MMHGPIERRGLDERSDGSCRCGLHRPSRWRSWPLFLLMPLVGGVRPGVRAKGIGVYWRAVTEPEALRAMRLTLLTAVLVVPLNLVFGVAAAWAIARFEFPRQARC